MIAAAGLALPHGAPGVPAGPGRAGRAGSEEPLPRGAASRICCSRQPIGAAAGDGATSFIHKKEAQRSWEARPSRHPRPVRGMDTYGNPPRHCYPSSRRPRRISRWRGCTARSGTGTGSPRTP